MKISNSIDHWSRFDVLNEEDQEKDIEVDNEKVETKENLIKNNQEIRGEGKGRHKEISSKKAIWQGIDQSNKRSNMESIST